MSYGSWPRKGIATLVGLAALLVASCGIGPAGAGNRGGGGTGSRPGPVYPGAEWARVDPVRAGFDPEILEEIAAGAGRAGSNCLVVIRHGRLVADWYWNGADATSPQEVFSTTKSYASTLVGIAQADGDLDIHDSASEYIPEWAGTPAAAVTIEDILANDSGRHWDEISNNEGVLTAPDRTAFGIGLPQDAQPGEIWAYNNAAIQTLDAVLREATGQEPAALAEERLFDPLGMARSQMTRDGGGNTNMYFGLQSTCQDMARFGYLFLRHGRWDGARIVPQSWVRAATGRPSQDLNAAYGYLWWLNRRGPIASELETLTREEARQALAERWVPGAPASMYWARGLGGQVIQVDPGSDTVVVRLGSGDASTTFGEDDTARVVTDALVRPGR